MNTGSHIFDNHIFSDTCISDYVDYIKESNMYDRIFYERFSTYYIRSMEKDDYIGYEIITEAMKRTLLNHKYDFDKVHATLGLEYNVLENYDRSEYESVDVNNNYNNDSHAGVSTKKEGYTDIITNNEDVDMHHDTDETLIKTNNVDTNTTNPTMTVTRSNSNVPFNESDYNYTKKEEEKTIYSEKINVNEDTSGTDSNIAKNSDYGNNITTVTEDISEKKETITRNENSGGHSDGNTTRNAHIHGNIGVTTPMDMIFQEREVANFSMYVYILDKFFTDHLTMYGGYDAEDWNDCIFGESYFY